MKRLAPAKINLSLKVSGRRPDGYHEIETFIAPISLSDTITVESTEGGGIALECSDPDLPCDASNLAWKAAVRFFQATGVQKGIHIRVEKRIPAGAGLGGGSSDAAAVILILDALCETKLPTEELERIAAQIGSDVPFFIRGVPAVCRGRGEVIQPVTEKIAWPLLLLKPPFEVSTAWAYQAWKDSRQLASVSYAPQKVGGITLENDLERPVFQKYLFLALLKSWLLGQAGVRGALMSGSGAVVYAVLREASVAERLIRDARAQFGETLWAAPAETVIPDSCP